MSNEKLSDIQATPEEEKLAQHLGDIFYGRKKEWVGSLAVPWRVRQGWWRVAREVLRQQPAFKPAPDTVQIPRERLEALLKDLRELREQLTASGRHVAGSVGELVEWVNFPAASAEEANRNVSTE
jgi:FAD/FMN-containing dehydrogenase